MPIIADTGTGNIGYVTNGVRVVLGWEGDGKDEQTHRVFISLTPAQAARLALMCDRFVWSNIKSYGPILRGVNMGINHVLREAYRGADGYDVPELCVSPELMKCSVNDVGQINDIEDGHAANRLNLPGER